MAEQRGKEWRDSGQPHVGRVRPTTARRETAAATAEGRSPRAHGRVDWRDPRAGGWHERPAAVPTRASRRRRLRAREASIARQQHVVAKQRRAADATRPQQLGRAGPTRDAGHQRRGATRRQRGSAATKPRREVTAAHAGPRGRQGQAKWPSGHARAERGRTRAAQADARGDREQQANVHASVMHGF